MSDRPDKQTVEITETSDMGDGEKPKTTTIRLTNHYELLYNLGVSALKQSPVVALLAFLCYLVATGIPLALNQMKESNLAVQEATQKHDETIRKETQARYEMHRQITEERHKTMMNLVEKQQSQNEKALELYRQGQADHKRSLDLMERQQTVIAGLLNQVDRGQRKVEGIERKVESMKDDP